MSIDASRDNSEWARIIRELFGDLPPVSARWTQPAEIVKVLNPFVRSGHSHMFIPGGGGHDVQNVRLIERGSGVEVVGTATESVRLIPRALCLEFFPEGPRQSFLLLETDRALRSDIFGRGSLRRGGGGGWQNAAKAWGKDGEARFLFCDKGSCWNSTAGNFDAYGFPHNTMTSAKLRQAVEERFRQFSHRSSPR